MLNYSYKNLTKLTVPISRFHQGEADKIFDEVNEYGTKVVMKNNEPACILLSTEQYEAMMELLEDLELFKLAEQRMTEASQAVVTQSELLERFGISEEVLAAVEVEIE